ncbi:hypothetical protein IG631_08399 [Alternaria alternata]|nr:hypothetical protein IG631_08399 [Alternaria alternata]
MSPSCRAADDVVVMLRQGRINASTPPSSKVSSSLQQPVETSSKSQGHIYWVFIHHKTIMRGTIIFVLASFILPALAGPVPVQDTVALGVNTNIEQRASAANDHAASRDLSERTPIIETIPVEERSPLDVETNLEKRIKRPGGGWRRNTNNDIEKRIKRPGNGWRRSADGDIEKRIKRPGGGWKKRSMAEWLYAAIPTN